MTTPVACIAMMGNLNDGFTPVGPFQDFDAAAEWSEQHLGGQGWIMEMVSPEKAAEMDKEEL